MAANRVTSVQLKRLGVEVPEAPKALPAIPGVGRRKGRSQEMNALEAEYATHLNELLHDGKVLWWGFQCIKLRLAKKTWYEPDFLVMQENGELEVHEVKGHWEDDARVKIKVAADILPFRFKALTRPAKAAGWFVEVIGGES